VAFIVEIYSGRPKAIEKIELRNFTHAKELYTPTNNMIQKIMQMIGFKAEIPSISMSLTLEDD